jgi:hypothetical protein
MKKYFLTSIFLILFLCINCGKDDTIVSPTAPELIINEKVTSQDSLTFKASINAISDSSLTVKKGSALSKDITEGSIIISDYGEGICRYVESITETADALILSTRIARLDEVIKQGRIEYTATLTPELMKQAYNCDDRFTIQNGKFVINFGNFKLSANFSLEIKTTFDPPTIVFILEIKDGTTYLEASILINNTTSAITEITSITGTYERVIKWPPKGKEEEKSSCTIPLPKIPTGVAFLWITPKLQFAIGVDASFNFEVSYETIVNTRVMAGVKYSNKRLTPNSSINFDWTCNPYKYPGSEITNTSFEIKPYALIPKLGFYVEGVLGPFIELELAASLKANINNTSKRVRLGVYPLLAAKWGVEFDLFGLIEITNDFEIFKKDFPVIRWPSFIDVPLNYWAYAAIDELYWNGYVEGISKFPPMYGPANILTRAEAAVFVERGIHGANYTPPEPKTQVFVDVPVYPNNPANNPWYAKWVNKLYDDGYTAGVIINGQRYYEPLRNLNRAEGTVFFVRMLKGKDYVPPTPTIKYYSDVPLQEWYARWVYDSYLLFKDCEDDVNRKDSRFRPLEGMTRAEAASMMAKAKRLIPF